MSRPTTTSARRGCGSTWPGHGPRSASDRCASTSAACATVAIKQLGDRGVETLLVCDVQTARPLQRAGADVVRRLTASGKLIFVMPPGLDHSLLGYAGKETTARTLTDYVIRRFVAE